MSYPVETYERLAGEAREIIARYPQGHSRSLRFLNIITKWIHKISTFSQVLVFDSQLFFF